MAEKRGQIVFVLQFVAVVAVNFTEKPILKNPSFQELDILSDMVTEYEDIHFSFSRLTLPDVIRLRMYERSLTQAVVAQFLGINPSRMSELMHGKMEPSNQLSREFCLKLNIEPSIVLGA